VRVDILERLADLIRPALSWREGSGSKPPGAIAGGGFTVVSGMTSLTGASGEDFASILRSLGYRMERRPKPPEPVTPATEPAAGPSAVEPIQEAAATSDGEAGATPSDAEAAAESTDRIIAPAIDAAESAMAEVAPEGQAESVGVDPEPSVPPSTEIHAELRPDEAAGSTPGIEAGAEVVQATAMPDQSATEPALIEVWRPGRTEGSHRPRQKHRDRHRSKNADTAPAQRAEEPALAAAPAGEAAASQPAARTPPTGALAPKQDHHPRHRRRHAGEHRPDRPQRDRDRPQRERDRPPVKRFERREKAPDPNSPFAKLAALKAQLEAEAKERR
jgi:ATP-dependent RNA helicase SUPV3L1/SUV3